MYPAPSATVHGLNGLRGVVLTTSCPPDDKPSQIAVRLDDGTVVIVPENQLILQDDGTYFLPMGRDGLTSRLAAAPIELSANTAASEAAAAAVPAGKSIAIPRVEERLRIGKTNVEQAVRIHKSVQEREEVVDVPLMHEHVDVERVAINRVVDTPPGVRQDGDVTVIPVLEEVLVVEKRLMLREELRVTRRKSERHEPQRVTLRSEHITVARDGVKNG